MPKKRPPFAPMNPAMVVGLEFTFGDETVQIPITERSDFVPFEGANTFGYVRTIGRKPRDGETHLEEARRLAFWRDFNEARARHAEDDAIRNLEARTKGSAVTAATRTSQNEARDKAILFAFNQILDTAQHRRVARVVSIFDLAGKTITADMVRNTMRKHTPDLLNRPQNSAGWRSCTNSELATAVSAILAPHPSAGVSTQKETGT